MPWFDDPVAAALALPPLALALFVFASACLEYVFPPYWGDTFMLLGFFLAGQGAAPPAMIFAAAFGGSVLGSITAYILGRRYGMAVVHRVTSRRGRKPSRGRILDLFQRHGERLLLINRFLPVVRGVLLYAAGAMRLPFRPSFLYCTLSNLAFVSLLMWVGLWTAGSWPEIRAAFQRSNTMLGAAALVAAGIWLTVKLSRQRRRRSESSEGP